MPLSTTEKQDPTKKIAKEILSNTNFLQQALQISKFKKENKASNVHVNLNFSIMPKDLFVPITHENENKTLIRINQAK